MSETKAMTVRLPQDRANELEAVAEVEDIPVAEAVRAAIDTYIEERRRDDAFRARLRASLERNRQILERLADS
jgi:predicted DNA-binding protein